jgi:hypothetical protein
VVTHTASQTHTPRTLALSPTIEPPSGVNENIPFNERSGSLGRMWPASPGKIRADSSSQRSKSWGVNGISDGRIGPPGARIPDCGVTIGSCR